MFIRSTLKSARFVSVLIVVAFLGAPHPAQGMITTGKGNEPVHDPGWPAGALAVANLETRVGWEEGPPFGGGDWTFYYCGDTAKFQNALNAFSTINAEHLEVVLHEGRGKNSIIELNGYDWSFDVWVPEKWEHLYNNPDSFDPDSFDMDGPVPAPRMEVWLWEDGPDWSKIEVPANMSVRDQRATSNGFPPGSGSVIRATITDYQGKPIPGSTLRIMATGDDSQVHMEVTVESQGEAIATGVQAGSYHVFATAPGYAPRFLGYSSCSVNDYLVFVGRLAPEVSLAGTVVDENGHPLGNVKVWPLGFKGPDGLGYPMYSMTEKLTAMTDDQGHFELSGVPVGKLLLQCDIAGYKYRWDPKEPLEIRKEGLPDGSECVLRMTPTGTVRIQLVNVQGNPVTIQDSKKIRIYIQEADRFGAGCWNGESTADTNGVCEFKEIPSGRYRFSSRDIFEGQPPDANEIMVTVQPHQATEAKLTF